MKMNLIRKEIRRQEKEFKIDKVCVIKGHSHTQKPCTETTSNLTLKLN